MSERETDWAEFLDKKVIPFRRVTWVRQEGGYVVWRRGTGDNAELLHVRTYEKGKGHGRQLVYAMLRALADAPPYYSVYGFTRVDNAEAQAFYGALGFQLVEVPGVYADGRAVLFHAPYVELVSRMEAHEARREG